MNFLLSRKGDTGLIFAPLDKIGMTFLSTLVRSNIEENTRIFYPFNYGKYIFLSFSMDMRTHLMDPRPHTPILPQKKKPSGLNSLALQDFRLQTHSVCNSTLCLYSSYEKDKRPVAKNGTVAERKSRIRDLKNKFVLELGT